MNARNVNVMLHKTLAGEASALETSLHGPMSEQMRDTREALLRHAPTQRQIDGLTQLMSEHFERLFSGQVYQLQNGTPIDPVAAFEVDAALLHAIIARAFRNPAESWRRILQAALGGRAEVITDGGDNLLSIAHKVKRAWQGSGEEGRFGHALRAGCQTVFVDAHSMSAEPVAIADDMLEDAASLIGAIQDIVRREE